MSFEYFSRNGQILPIDRAVVPLSNIEYAYGFGVYETIKVNQGVIYFLEQHSQRLLASAKIIGLEHDLTTQMVQRQVNDLVAKLGPTSYNLKLMLIGGSGHDDYLFDITASNPLFPDRKLYVEGATLITYQHERLLPHAKSLNMLPSYLAYRKAKVAHAYDALLVDDDGFVTEGSRTNFFVMQGTTIISPPEDTILLGVMRSVVLREAQTHGFDVKEQPLRLDELGGYEAAFVTSTSSKVMPVKAVDDIVFGAPSSQLRELIEICNTFLKSCGGRFES